MMHFSPDRAATWHDLGGPFPRHDFLAEWRTACGATVYTDDTAPAGCVPDCPMCLPVWGEWRAARRDRVAAWLVAQLGEAWEAGASSRMSGDDTPCARLGGVGVMASGQHRFTAEVVTGRGRLTGWGDTPREAVEKLRAETRRRVTDLGRDLADAQRVLAVLDVEAS